jgi:acetyl esterase/lipase
MMVDHGATSRSPRRGGGWRRRHVIVLLGVLTAVLPACSSDDPGEVSAAGVTDSAVAASEATTTASAGPTTTTTIEPLATSTTTLPVPVGVPAPVADDVAYADISPAQRLDVYVPSGPAPHPLVVFIHGGAWMTGDKRAEYAAGTIPILLDAGYAVASINYRLSTEAIFPAQLLDAKAAIRWLRAHADDYGLDPTRFAAAGESAGAHLAALLGTSTGEASLDDPALGNAEVSSAVQAVVDFYGPVDLAVSEEQLAENPACAGTLRDPGEADPAAEQLLGAPVLEVPELAAAANPITYLVPGRDVPPFLIAHGDVDCVVPYQGSVVLHEAIEAMAGPGTSQLIIVPGSGHYTAFDAASVVPAVLTFLATVIGPEISVR